MRIWRKTNAERQALRGCCGGLVDRKVHSKKVHSQRMETFKMEWRSYSNMYSKSINIKDPIWSKFLCMPCMLDMHRISGTLCLFG